MRQNWTWRHYRVDQMILGQNLFKGSEAKDVEIEDKNSFRSQRIQGDRQAWRCHLCQRNKKILKACGLVNFCKLNFTSVRERGLQEIQSSGQSWVALKEEVFGRARARPTKSIYCVLGINLSRNEFWTQPQSLCTKYPSSWKEYPPQRISLWCLDWWLHCREKE